MVIFILEPYYTDSHKHWSDGIKTHAKADVKVFKLPAKHWKWRMHAGAITLASQIRSLKKPDHIIVSDMCDLSVLKSNLPKEWNSVTFSIYFHENQITFPWKKNDQDVVKERNNHYGFINYTSALAADYVFFNSNFHLEDFFNSLPDFLQQFPDFKNLDTIVEIKKKSSVQTIGIDLQKPFQKWNADIPIILWNHRWEYDKNPELFFKTLFKLKDKGASFQLIVTGNSGKDSPTIFSTAKEYLHEEIIHWGYCEARNTYHELMQKAHIAPVTSIQDYFGISALEAISHQAFPLMPHRLAFPEHISEKWCFYKNDSEFIQTLSNLIINFNQLKKELATTCILNSKEIQVKYSWNVTLMSLMKVLNSSQSKV